MARHAAGVWTVALALAVGSAGATWWLTRHPGRECRPDSRDVTTAVLWQAFCQDGRLPLPSRLSGSSSHLPLEVLQPGDRVTPRVALAAAQLEQAAASGSTVDTLTARGLAALVLGRLDAAVDLLEQALERRPASAAVGSDLSAAYLARASRSGHADDWVRALSAAERALQANPGYAQAAFNRAVAVEALHLEAAPHMWQAYLDVETSPGWRAEAGRRLARAQRERVCGGEGGAPGTDLQEQREEIEDRVLNDWARAWLRKDAGVGAEALARARHGAVRLAESGGDSMPRDEIERIVEAQALGRRDVVDTFAHGHVAYAEARRAFAGEDLARAAAGMEQAAVAFRRVGSRYAYWAAIYQGILLRVRGDDRRADAVVRSIPLSTLPEGYHHLRGRYHWTRALAADTGGQLDRARLEYGLAIASFERAREAEHLAATTIHAAEIEWTLGEPARAWALARSALAMVGCLPLSTRRNVVLLTSAYVALSDDLPAAALHFQNDLLSSLGRHPDSVGRGDAFMQRARILQRLGRRDEAFADLARAEGEARMLSDRTLQARLTARVLAARAELEIDGDPAQAARLTADAIAIESRQHRALLPQYHVLHARALLRANDPAGSEAALERAVEIMERARILIGDDRDRMQAFQDARPVLSALAEFEWLVRKDALRTLQAVERARAPSYAYPGGAGADPVAVGRRLAPATAVVYTAHIGDRVICWAISREGGVRVAGDVPAAEVDEAAAALARTIRHGVTTPDLGAPARRLRRLIVEPVVGLRPAVDTLVVIADGPLAEVPFGMLSDDQGRLLLERMAVVVAPSLAAFSRASRRGPPDAPLDNVRALGVDRGDPQRDLPRLPQAIDEAVSVARQYARGLALTGDEATAEALLGTRESVLHVAAHSVVNRRYPLYSRLLLAPEPETGHDGALFAADLVGRVLPSTNVVVLASCEAAAGRFIVGDGAVSLARVFLDAGASAVVASVWPVDDRATPFLLAFHRELRDRGDAGDALRAAQRAAWRAGTLPPSAWGGFVVVGGQRRAIQGG